MPNKTTIWDTPGAIAFMTREWISGTTGTVIARSLAEAFGARVTREMVIGKASRLGLMRAPTGPRASRPDPVPATISLAPVTIVAVEDDGREAEADLAIIQAAPTCDPVTLLDVQPHHCRWPIGDPRKPGFGFCGAQKANPHSSFHSYCAAHSRLAFQPGTAAKQARAA